MGSTVDKRREPSCVLNHDAQRRKLRDEERPPAPCPACGWVLSAMRDRPSRLQQVFRWYCGMCDVWWSRKGDGDCPLCGAGLERGEAE